MRLASPDAERGAYNVGHPITMHWSNNGRRHPPLLQYLLPNCPRRNGDPFGVMSRVGRGRSAVNLRWTIMANNSTKSEKIQVIHAGFLLADPDIPPKSEQSILIEG